jgi:hypothetical protein
MKYIKIQRDLGTTVEVASGLGPGDRVINNPPDSLSEGQLVRISGASSRATPARRG